MNKKLLFILFICLLLLTGCGGNTAYVSSTKMNTEYSMYIGNKNSHKFHKPDCYTLPYEENRIYFGSTDEALSTGFAPCKNCKP